MEQSRRRVTLALGLLVFAVSLGVYLTTLTPTVPFWDSGEFIAVSNILGIPHPPGTPFYVLIARLFTLIPIATIAQRVNSLSALASAIAVLFTYLTTLRLIRLAQGRGMAGEPTTAPGGAAAAPDTGAEWLAQFGAVIAALMLAFSDNFWENAIEAEVYSMMSMAQILVLWLGLRWWEDHEKSPTVGPLLLCVYVMWLSVGMHLGVGMMGLPLLVLVWLVDRNAFVVFLIPFFAVLGVTFGLENMLGIVLLLSVLVFFVYAAQKKLSWALWWVGIVFAGIAIVPAFGDANFNWWTGACAAAAILVPLASLARRAREGRIIALALALMVVGYSTHLYLPIRAAQHPAINEGNPSNWANLRDLLERKQYGSRPPLKRGGEHELSDIGWIVRTQFGKEFWRYWKRQWPIAASPRPVGPMAQSEEPAWWQYLLPLALGVVGAVFQWRERRSFQIMAVLMAFSTLGMIAFLNFTDHEVRDRDYFFTTGYHGYAIWIGMGAAWLVGWVRESFSDPGQGRVLGYAAALLLLVQPFQVMRTLWFTHDRRGNFVAHDYAYDMLAPLAPNSYVFTNGDNDTFPLWYMQEVENFRQDVRVVNLSLLNTDWYIQQLRDDPPRVPIHLDDATIKMLGQGAVQDTNGRYILTNEYMVRHIIKQSEQGTHGWSKQPYFAVTVPEHMGFQPQFTLEGLVYRVNRDTLQGDLDEKVTRHALYDVFKYRGLFLPDGSWDPRVYKDENASTLSRNFAAAHLQLAYYYRRQGKLDRGIAEMERVARMFPDFSDVLIPLGGFYMDHGDTAKALALFEKLTINAPNNPEAFYSYGLTLAFKGDIEKALKQFDRSIELEPNYSQAFYGAYYCLNQSGQHDRAMGYIRRWVDQHPNDAQARALLEAGGPPRHPSSSQALPKPPQPNLP